MWSGELWLPSWSVQGVEKSSGRKQYILRVVDEGNGAFYGEWSFQPQHSSLQLLWLDPEMVPHAHVWMMVSQLVVWVCLAIDLSRNGVGWPKWITEGRSLNDVTQPLILYPMLVLSYVHSPSSLLPHGLVSLPCCHYYDRLKLWKPWVKVNLSSFMFLWGARVMVM